MSRRPKANADTGKPKQAVKGARGSGNAEKAGNKRREKREIFPDVTSRDVDIFKIVSSGIHTAAQIKVELGKFVSKYPKAPDDKGDRLSRVISWFALRRRLSKLGRDGYFESKKYPYKKDKRDNNSTSGIKACYVLGEAGEEYLIKNHSYNPKHIRRNLPHKKHLSHEFQVVSIVKTIKREGNSLGYSYDMEDEDYLKGRTRGAKKGIPYPDLHVRLSFKMGRDIVSRNVAIELDNGSTHPRHVAEKARILYDREKWLNIFLCPNSERIETLRAGFADYIEEQKARAKDAFQREDLDKHYLRSFFATTYEFFEKAFLGTTWKMIGDREAVIVPQDYKAPVKKTP